ncbi:MAG: DNA adenine methylase [Gloeomargaritaceae cyanobacterium C42_A2020_066]|nr:DNA adenine methylase [Gloeomargaritaceae cyanobacterium C42_A2020_066]
MASDHAPGLIPVPDRRQPVEAVVNVASVSQRSPFRYPGGKTWLVPRIRQWMAAQSPLPQLLVEPFVGGGIVSLTAVFEGYVDQAVLVELDPDVHAVWAVATSPEHKALSERILEFTVTREAVLAELASEPRTVLDRAFKTILKNRMFHGGILAPGASLIKSGEQGRGLLSRWYPQTLARRLQAIGEIRDRLTVVCGDGMTVIEQYAQARNTLFFIDPPYTAAGKRAGRRLYRYHDLDHERLFAVTAQVQGDFLMTYDYAVGVCALAQAQGFDMACVPMKNTHHAQVTELLIGRSLAWLDP